DLANLCILHHLPASTAASGSASAPAPSGPSPLSGLKGLDLEALGIPQQSELMAAYRRAASASSLDPGSAGVEQRLAGLAGPGVAELGLAFVFFKMAVIAHGVKARLSRGVASSTQASVVSAMVPTMIALAKEQVWALRRIVAAEGSGDGGTDRGGRGDTGGGTHGEAGGARRVKAVLFDVGGVLSESPLLAISQFEREAHPGPLPPSYIGVAIAAAGEVGLFQRLERGEELLGDRFLERFEEYLVSAEAKGAYVDWCVARRRATVRRNPSSPSSALPSPPPQQLSTASASQGGGRTTRGPAPRAATNIVVVGGRRNERGGGGTKEEAEAAVAGVVAVDTPELFRRITAAARVPVPRMIAFAQALRRRGFKVGVVSNDFKVEPGFVLGLPRSRPHLREDKCKSAGGEVPAGTKEGGDGDGAFVNGSNSGSGSGIGGGVYSRLPALCDVVILSSTTGSRKPNPEIYESACQALGVSPWEAVFVDDIRENIRAAEALGMRTVWVASGGSLAGAISELEAVTGVQTTASTRGWGRVRQPPGKL
ncbi:unnamed protein product, partial [Hapterophycus canaliculatus]